ncbi:MAG TPA: helix-hairpin-helix domain-containing protein [Pseudogracilibacillus sp.]|nr:helix-hairpin-helix domain-containing protein [Pseudogracilibacillus sp.]
MIHVLRKHLLLIGIGLAVIIGIFVLWDKGLDEEELDFEVEPPIELENHETVAEQEEIKIMVDVKGEVAQPGVYEIDSETRVNDVVLLAGGFSKDADQHQINLAQKVHDEMVIIVPKKGENPIVDITVDAFTGEQDTDKININQATKEEIETLSGIGPAKAQAIIDYREENGLFQSIEDLQEVSGIGEKTIENIENDIIIP